MKKKFWPILLSFFAIGVFIRFYRLGSIPQGFFSDEAAVGYNAYSLIKTGRDEFGKPWPFLFTSFGEGKLPFYIYQAVPSVFLFGPNEFAVRFPGAFFGSLTILVWFFLLQEFLKLSKLERKYHIAVGLASVFVLALMPWHIHFSRGVFGQESVFWIVFGSWSILRGLRIKKQILIFFGFIGLSLSPMIYHAPKVVLPFWTPTLLWLVWKRLDERFIPFVKKVILGVFILLISWGVMSFSLQGMARSKGISVFSVHSGVFAKVNEDLFEEGELGRPIWYARILHNKIESYGRDIIGRYLSHFNPDFLFVSGDLLRPRYRVLGVAQIYLIFLPFALVGLYYLVYKKVWLVLALAAIAPLPAALTFETPSTVRALLLAIPLSAVIGIGLTISFSYLKSFYKNLFWIIGALFTVGLFYQFIYFFNSYFYLAQIHKPYEWQYGYKPLVKKVVELQGSYDEVVVTSMGGPPYIFFLFYQLYDPLKFQQEVHSRITERDSFGFIHIAGFSKYKFPKAICPFNKEAKKTLFVCRGDDKKIDRKYVLDTIYFGDQTPAFTILDPENEI